MKGLLIILLFTGETSLVPFTYNSISKDNDEIVVACSNKAEQLRTELSTHSWTDPRGQGWYLNDGTGTLQGHIC